MCVLSWAPRHLRLPDELTARAVRGGHVAPRVTYQREADDPTGRREAGGEEGTHPKAVEVKRPADNGANPGGREQRRDARDGVVDA